MAKKTFKSGLDSLIQSTTQPNVPAPEEQTIPIFTRLPHSLNVRLGIYKAKTGKQKAKIIEDAIKEYLDQHEGLD
jgi:hypothetical protein